VKLESNLCLVRALLPTIVLSAVVAGCGGDLLGPSARGPTDSGSADGPSADGTTDGSLDAADASIDSTTLDVLSPDSSDGSLGDAPTDAQDAANDAPQASCPSTDAGAAYDGGPPLVGITQLMNRSFRSDTMCAIDASGNVFCWGANNWGQLATGSTLPAGTDRPVAATLLSGPVTQVTATNEGLCAVAGGGVTCWGGNTWGNLGHEVGFDGDMPCGGLDCNVTPVAVAGLPAGPPVVAVGSEIVCAVAGGALACWGANNAGQLGIGALDSTPVAHPVPSIAIPSGALDVSVGAFSACALTSGGSIRCWGLNADGELGHAPGTDGDQTCNNRACSPSPVAVAGITGALGVGVGGSQACAILSDRSVDCWGAAPQTTTPMPPTVLSGLANVQQITMTDGGCSCALRGDGTVACWGPSFQGCLGLGCSDTQTHSPTTVPGLAGVLQIASTRSATCALLADGNVMCWGYGAIGNGDPFQQAESPTPVVSP